MKPRSIREMQVTHWQRLRAPDAFVIAEMVKAIKRDFAAITQGMKRCYADAALVSVGGHYYTVPE